MVAGANDYCSVPTAGGTWAGFYYSSNGGSTWTNSLLPGYPTDTSAEGMESPLFGLVDNAGDPVQEWDNFGHLYFGGIAFTRTQPANASIGVARYTWHVGAQPDDAGGNPNAAYVVYDASVPGTETPTGTSFGTIEPGVGSQGSIYFAKTTNGGASWSAQRVSAVSQMPQYEQFGFRDVPFHGDYNYVSAVGSTVLMAWTDQRDTVPGVDARYLESGDGTDGFDVLNCIVGATDACANDGGLNQNVYGFVP